MMKLLILALCVAYGKPWWPDHTQLSTVNFIQQSPVLNFKTIGFVKFDNQNLQNFHITASNR